MTNYLDWKFSAAHIVLALYAASLLEMHNNTFLRSTLFVRTFRGYQETHLLSEREIILQSHCMFTRIV